jgi:hypothetical protein
MTADSMPLRCTSCKGSGDGERVIFGYGSYVEACRTCKGSGQMRQAVGTLDEAEAAEESPAPEQSGPRSRTPKPGGSAGDQGEGGGSGERCGDDEPRHGGARRASPPRGAVTSRPLPPSAGI